MLTNRDQKYIPKDYGDTNLKMASSVVQELVNWTEQLSQKIQALPSVDKDSKSECPYAERLYAEKNELIECVIEKWNSACSYKRSIEDAIEKQRQRLNIITTDANKIHQRKTRDGYSLAAVDQEYIIKKAIDQKRVLKEALAWSAKIIQTAKSARYPGKTPEKKFIPPTMPVQENPPLYNNLVETPSTPSESPKPGQFNNEIQNLFSAGPLPLGGEII